MPARQHVTLAPQIADRASTARANDVNHIACMELDLGTRRDVCGKLAMRCRTLCKMKSLES